MRFVFRTDSSLQIGTGHLMRCLTLAEELAGRGHEVGFICRDLPGNVASLVRDKGITLELLPRPELAVAPAEPPNIPQHTSFLGVDPDLDAAQTAAAIDHLAHPVDWLVVDHYGIDARWEGLLRTCCDHLMVIDDLADRRHDCDLLLDQNLYSDMGHRYDGLVPERCRTLLGPRYALLRPQFPQARQNLRVRSGKIRRILVSFGGVDATNETLKALKALDGLKRPDIAVDVAVGATNTHREQLASFCASRPNVIVHVQTNRMAELMAEADLGIGAGGVVTWERCCVALPTIAWPVADNQRQVVAEAAAHGALYCPDEDSTQTAASLSQHLFAILHSVHLCRSLSDGAFSLCDGRGAYRRAQVLAPSTIGLRAAEATDSESIHRWRNHPDIRRVSLNHEPISFETHQTWFMRSLTDPNRLLLIAEHQETPVGVLRYDLSGDEAEVSVFLIPGKSGQGLGSAVLGAGEKWLRDAHPEITRIRAAVLTANRPSLALFEQAGYAAHHFVYEKCLPQ